MSAPVLLFYCFHQESPLAFYLFAQTIGLSACSIHLHLLQNKGIFLRLLVTSIFGERLTTLNDTVAWILGGKRTPCRLY